MVKTRTSFEDKEFSDDENDESIALRRTRRRAKVAPNQAFFRHSTDKVNGCDSKTNTFADESTSGRSVISKHESDDSFDPSNIRVRRLRRKINRLTYRNLINDVVRNRTTKNVQPNVRRSGRQRKSLFNTMNESIIESGPYEELDNHCYFSTVSNLANNHQNLIDEKPKKKPGYHELKRLGLINKLPSDVESDMYSKIKTSRRKMIPNQDAGAVADTEETEEASGTECTPSKRRLRRKRLSEQNPTSETQSSSESSSESESEEIMENKAPTKYYLRPKRQLTQKIEEVTDTGPKLRPRHRHHHHRTFKSPIVRRSHRRRFAHNSSSESSSSSDEARFERRKSENMMRARSRCLPMNFESKDALTGILRERRTVGSSLADIDPMDIDKSVLFDRIGGLDEHIQSLKEMVLFPLLYPEVFAKYKIQPPRGVLFHGPPGTGKTLVARALANECSQGGTKVAFFMRKGADCLSKWVGESERQLRLLFDQAYLMRPSIVFFDEIDGIAPVRSTRQDQIHSSIVSTLLALMDGLDSRGEVIVIGATNRIEAIDPALRRPGRFDREFYFPLPSLDSRKKILEIHTKEWSPPLSPSIINTLAVLTANYCGADLKALCAEAALIALKRRYPQIYKSRAKLLLNTDEINISINDFITATKKIVPSIQRSTNSCSRPLSIVVKPLLHRLQKKAIEIISEIFPASRKNHDANIPFVDLDLPNDDTKLDNISIQPLQWVGNFRPMLLIHGQKGMGHSSHLAPSILHHFENISHLKLDLPSLYAVSTRSPEESLANLFLEAYKRIPSTIYMPRINQWWGTLSETLRTTLSTIIDDMESNIPILILATSDCHFDELSEDLKELFCENRSSKRLLEMSSPSRKERELFFAPLFEDHIYKKPSLPSKSIVLEELPLAPPPEPRKLTEKETERLIKQEEATLRELRLFLRDVLAKLLRDRRFAIFVKPVDTEEVPDYLEVIKNPMNLELMMAKIDTHQYQLASQFLADIDLICYNALEYNPDRDSSDKMIRHRACALRDSAYALIDEMHSDFETQCEAIKERRDKRGETPSKFAPSNYKVVPLANATNDVQQSCNNADEDTEIESSNETGCETIDGKKRTSNKLNKTKKKLRTEDVLNDIVNSSESVVINGRKLCPEVTQKAQSNETSNAVVGHSEKDQNEKADEIKELIIDRNKVKRLMERVVETTNGCNVDELEELYSTIYRLISELRNEWNRSCLEKKISAEVDKFERLHKRHRF
ncbi:ATPase family AAA domain-containing protein 2-like protein [Dinothrombium tinctorium]|uniref:Tat-binding homolog 7 n=1 Tax=Dinothrombium tinctorium TaxID=1965070 RepID=A0A443RRR2_9ACAR|nr:ATPase family AAA domain-containing protein 2-like protein [Dinothrombium tinctorium]